MERNEAAIVVVAKRPMAGQVKTRLCPPLTPEQAQGLAEAFLADTLTVAGQLLDADLLIGYAPAESRSWFAATYPSLGLFAQGEGDLGERLTRLFESAFAAGYRRVALIGADAPFLTASRLGEAMQALQTSGDLVLGAAHDGGYYLIGLQEPTPWLFEAMPWSSEKVLEETLRRVRLQGREAILLAQERDIDTPEDLAWLQANRRLLEPSSATAHYLTYLMQ